MTNKDAATVPPGVTVRPDNSLWIVKKIDDTYYHVIHAATGKFVIYEVPLPNDPNYNNKPNEGDNGKRKTMHLQTPDNESYSLEYNENYKFIITLDNNGIYRLVPKRRSGWYWNPANGNKDKYYGDSSPVYQAGLVGVYNGVNDGGSKWHFEPALCQAPDINYNISAGNYTITWHGLTAQELMQRGDTIRYIEYTGTGTAPDPTLSSQVYSGGTVVVQNDGTTVNAIVTSHGIVISRVASRVVNTATPEAPTFEMTCDSKLQINCNISTATIYYNFTTDGTNPTDPDNTSTPYTDPVSMADNTKVKAVAYNGSNPAPSPYSEVYTVMNNTTPPTFVLTETTATINHDHMANVTLHYTTDGSDPTDPNVTAQTYTGTNPLVISGLDYTHDVNILVYADSTGRGASCPVTVIKRPKQPTINPESECIGTDRIHTLTFTGTEEGKTYWYALSNGQNQPAPALNTFTEYTPGEEIDITTIPAWNGTDVWVTFHAYAKTADGYESHVVWQNYQLIHTAAPTITHTGNEVTIEAVTGATILYTVDGGGWQTYNGPFTVTNDYNHTIVAKAQYGSEGESCEAVRVIYLPITITSLSQITDMGKSYKLGSDITVGSGFSSFGTFSGYIDGDGHSIIGLNVPLITIADGAIIHDVKFKEVGIINQTGNVGTIAREAKGSTCIYNCGVLDGSVEGGTNVGGLVGLIQQNSQVRVVNCYNYADVSGSAYAAGIVGKNDGTVGPVRIALCMMYGSVTDATHISPVYTGNHIDNVKKFTEYNFYLYGNERDENGIRIKKINYTDYNDQLAIDDEEFLTRFPFYRHILNTHRELAAYFLFAGNTTTGGVADIPQYQINEIGHWTLDEDEAPYLIVEKWPTNTKKVLDAPTPSNILTEMGTNGYLTITVKIGNNTYTQNAQGQPYKLPITDMDEENFDYTWGKVVLPFANEFEVNTDYSKICTGWKITGITGGNGVAFSKYNVSDRNSTAKDLYANTNFIFAQGGNYVVPYNVTAIEITANFADAYYLSDATYDVGYDENYKTPTGLGGNAPSFFHGHAVYHNIVDALSRMQNKQTPHEQAIVLVGNYHFPTITPSNASDNPIASYTGKAFTLMSIDNDNNQEPDYAWYSNNSLLRPKIAPVRWDFVAQIPLGMSSHVKGSKYYPGLPIWKPCGWYETTETSLSYMYQFELDSGNYPSGYDQKNAKCIINGGYFVQMVRSFAQACNKVKYYQIGGNAYIKEFYPGSHSAKNFKTTLVPINVTGGEIEQCFMTGYGKGTAVGNDIYFWCAGGKIHKFLGAYMEKPETSGVNMTAKIDHAIITRFFGGGTSANATITGNISVTIDNSRVDFYCGGPEFGDMSSGKTVTTKAKNTTFGEFYGAGFGGTSIFYTNDEDKTLEFANVTTPDGVDYPDYFTQHYLGSNEGRLKKHLTNNVPDGIGTCYKFEFIVHSYLRAVVARYYNGYAKFSLAKTGNVTNNLDGCTVLRNFYGGGCQGTVGGWVNSTLHDCTVYGNVFGAGYKATANDLDVYPASPVPTLSKFIYETGIFTDFGTQTPETYHWQQGDATNQYTNDGTTIYSDANVVMSDLGKVTGDVTLTINGESEIGTADDPTTGKVFGGGDQSGVDGSTTVKLQGKAFIRRDVFGGGNEAPVGTNSSVIFEQETPPSNPSGSPQQL